MVDAGHRGFTLNLSQLTESVDQVNLRMMSILAVDHGDDLASCTESQYCGLQHVKWAGLVIGMHYHSGAPTLIGIH